MKQLLQNWRWLLLAAVVLTVYGRVVGFDFLYWDDPLSITYNQNLLQERSPLDIGWMFELLTPAPWRRSVPHSLVPAERPVQPIPGGPLQ